MIEYPLRAGALYHCQYVRYLAKGNQLQFPSGVFSTKKVLFVVVLDWSAGWDSSFWPVGPDPKTGKSDRGDGQTAFWVWQNCMIETKNSWGWGTATKNSWGWGTGPQGPVSAGPSSGVLSVHKKGNVGQNWIVARVLHKLWMNLVLAEDESISNNCTIAHLGISSTTYSNLKQQRETRCSAE